jgi:hypothetical protein
VAKILIVVSLSGMSDIWASLGTSSYHNSDLSKCYYAYYFLLIIFWKDFYNKINDL